MKQSLLFPEVKTGCNTPTEEIKYAGSKLTMLPHILSTLAGLPMRRVLDGFAGTTRVSRALAQTGFKVIPNNVATWSYVFGNCYLLKRKSRSHFQPIIDHLNSLPGKDGWFTRHYGGTPNGGSTVQADGTKRPW